MQEELREVEYQPIPVSSLLVEMKNLSELMIDLAYSAVIFHDRELAEEVMELERRVDYLSYLLLMNASLAVRDKEDAEQMAGIMKAASAANKISDAAADIASLVLRDIGIHRMVRQAISSTADEIVGRATILSRSPLSGKTLGELKLTEEVGCDVIAVQRGREWTIHPPDSWRLQKGDRVIVRGTSASVRRLQEMAAGESTKVP